MTKTPWQAVKVIAFDLDGTLVDSVPDLAAATNATLSELNLANAQEQQVRSWVGNGAKVLMTRALSFAQPNKPVDEINQQLDSVMPRFMHHYGLHLEKHSELYPEVLETLTKFKTSGYKMAVVTNKPYEFTIPLLKSFGLFDFFEQILGGDSLTRMKPDPLPLIHLIDFWDVAPHQLLMVGDSKNDILAAKSAQVLSIGLTYGYNYGEHIGLSSPDAVCESFSQVGDLLLN
ncbi:phosphoglycolate phosphatase [Shewanella maritima]|uniref:phosphoglycolate phosphatase n=1 Tax=Shewanella maritima TaxID=2520507 RepID=UPI003734C3C3